ncbi:MAG: WecB/TagA/CpsF family glycosyltransferase [bacterium]
MDSKILEIKISNLDYNQIFKKISEFLNSPAQHRIITLNPEYVLEAQKDEQFKNIINNADLVVADGIGILWAAKFLSLQTSRFKILRNLQIVIQYIYTGASLIFLPSYCRSVIKEKVSGVNIVKKITNCELRITNCPIRIFLIGGYNGAAKKIKEKYPNTVVETYEGSPDIQNDKKTREIINQAQPNILFVAYGNPGSKQEKWISRNLPYLPSVKFAMGVGGSFDFLSGSIKRAPKWMQKRGIEWLWRLFRQPRRIKRIWNAAGVFSWQILKLKIKNNTSVIPNDPKGRGGSL